MQVGYFLSLLLYLHCERVLGIQFLGCQVDTDIGALCRKKREIIFFRCHPFWFTDQDSWCNFRISWFPRRYPRHQEGNELAASSTLS